MPSQKNQEMLKEVKEVLTSSDGMFVFDYRGLSVAQSQALRRKLRAAGSGMRVFKNNLVRIALKDENLPEVDSMLEGTSAFVFYQGDPVETAKVIKETTTEVATAEFKGGIIDASVLDKAQVLALADLPSRDELLAKFVGSISSPLSGLVRVCNGPIQNFVSVLSQVAEQKAAA